MSLTMGPTAPLGRPTGGSLNIEIPNPPAHLLFPRRFRGLLARDDAVTVVADTVSGLLLHETRMLPRLYLPRADVRGDLLEPSETTSHCPFKGDARYWHVRVGDRLVQDAFWDYPEPLPGCPDIAGLLSPYLERFDRWLEEDEEILGHPRDPFHRVDVRASSRPVVVRESGRVIADTARPLAVFETGLPTRWYIPAADVAVTELVPSATTTVCPYKGVATYRSLRGGAGSDVAWTYADPLPDAAGLAGHWSFDGPAITVEVG
jgi:uncharacterized protein (DUF427 family)